MAQKSSKRQTGQNTSQNTSQSGDRKARLAEALRENLKRRKAQARGRRDAPPQDGAQVARNSSD